jgi:hypothetical protein
MDETMKQFQESLIELETDAEHLLLARHQVNLLRPTNFCFELYVLVAKQEREKRNKNRNLGFNIHLYSLFNVCMLVLELKSEVEMLKKCATQTRSRSNGRKKGNRK